MNYETRKQLESGVQDLESTILTMTQIAWVREETAHNEELQYYRILLDWLACCDRILFGMIQDPHFEKHSLINTVFLKPAQPFIVESNSGKPIFKFRVQIELQKKKEHIHQDEKKMLHQEVLKDISDEVTKCSSVLETEKGNIVIIGYDFYEFENLNQPFESESFNEDRS